jgi:hypothetical protein
MRVIRSISDPVRHNASWEERWEGPDHGLIACWERGLEMRKLDPEVSARASEGRLVVLPWRGGVEKAVKKAQKFGTHYYLAMWRGLRGEDLDIDLAEEIVLTCTATGMTVVFTSDRAKYAEA